MIGEFFPDEADDFFWWLDRFLLLCAACKALIFLKRFFRTCSEFLLACR